jgi:hypothetical protein
LGVLLGCKSFRPNPSAKDHPTKQASERLPPRVGPLSKQGGPHIHLPVNTLTHSTLTNYMVAGWGECIPGPPRGAAVSSGNFLEPKGFPRPPWFLLGTSWGLKVSHARRGFIWEHKNRSSREALKCGSCHEKSIRYSYSAHLPALIIVNT